MIQPPDHRLLGPLSSRQAGYSSRCAHADLMVGCGFAAGNPVPGGLPGNCRTFPSLDLRSRFVVKPCKLCLGAPRERLGHGAVVLPTSTARSAAQARSPL